MPPLRRSADFFLPSRRSTIQGPCMASIGKRNALRVLRETESGFYLEGGDLGEILLPGNRAPDDLAIGDVLEVMVLFDSEDRLVATTERAVAEVGEFACLRVKGSHERIGTFLDWGLSKDLLLPFREQTRKLEPGEQAVVFIRLDPQTGRPIATARVHRHLEPAPAIYRPGREVAALIAGRTELGFPAIVDRKHPGLLYHTDLGAALEIGQQLRASVVRRRPDGKLDLHLDPPGPEKFDQVADAILLALDQNDGRLPFDDQTSSEAIRERFQTSKKSFKRALGTLYRRKRIRFHPSGGIERVP